MNTGPGQSEIKSVLVALTRGEISPEKAREKLEKWLTKAEIDPLVYAMRDLVVNGQHPK